MRDSLIKRIENVRRTGLADEIIIEEYQGQKVNDIIKYDIDVLVVGSDWRGKFDYLKNYCDVVYLERTKNISSTKLRSEGVIFNMGIVTDDIRDNDLWRNPNMSAEFMWNVYSARITRLHRDSVINMS